mgnify:CR=1 FL=1
MSATIKRSPTRAALHVPPKSVDGQVHNRLSSCPYSFFLNRITWEFDGERLTLEGCVPTFNMKQMLQSLLRNIDGVESLANKVDVISATGLSAIQRD